MAAAGALHLLPQRRGRRGAVGAWRGGSVLILLVIVRARIERMIFEAIIREGIEAGEFRSRTRQKRRAVRTAFMPFHPILIEHCVQHREDTGAGLREQIRFILKALGSAGRRESRDCRRPRDKAGDYRRPRFQSSSRA
jgi:hypothetical protein